MKYLYLCLLLFVFLVGCGEEESKPKRDGAVSSVDSEGVYLKLKSNSFIKLYSINTSLNDVVSVNHAAGRVSVVKGFNNRYRGATGNSFNDIFQSVEVGDLDGLLVKGDKYKGLTVHRAHLMITPSDETKKRARKLNEYQILDGQEPGIIVDIDKVDSKYVSRSAFMYNISNDNFGAFFRHERDFYIDKRETRDGDLIKLSKGFSSGIYTLKADGKYYWINVI